MGEIMETAAILAILAKDNPRADAGDLKMYADALADYRRAQANIDEHGPIVLHPRTGAPIQNPYIAIRDAAGKSMRSMKRIKGGSVW